jgi:hypothetical protein
MFFVLLNALNFDLSLMDAAAYYKQEGPKAGIGLSFALVERLSQWITYPIVS